MADVIVETYDICLGLGAQDPALVVAVTGLVSRERAKQLLTLLIEFRRLGAFAPAIFASGAEFFIRASAGITVEVSEATAAVIVKELAGASEPSVQLYVKQSKGEFVQIGAASISDLARFATP